VQADGYRQGINAADGESGADKGRVEELFYSFAAEVSANPPRRDKFVDQAAQEEARRQKGQDFNEVTSEYREKLPYQLISPRHRESCIKAAASEKHPAFRRGRSFLSPLPEREPPGADY